MLFMVKHILGPGREAGLCASVFISGHDLSLVVGIWPFSERQFVIEWKLY